MIDIDTIMNPAPPDILVAGIGNIFLGDDAFGVEVAQRLLARPQPPGVRVVDFGIRGLDLAYALLDGCGSAILIDALPHGQEPGTLYLMQPRMDHDPQAEPSPILLEAHSMNPLNVLRMVRSMGGKADRVLVVGCEPQPLPTDQDMAMEMSDAVRNAILPAIEMVDSLIERILAGEDAALFSQTAPARSIVPAQQECPQCQPSET